MKTIRKKLLQISPSEAEFSRRGFRTAGEAKQTHLEKIGTCFIRGYNAAVEHEYSPELIARLESVEAPFRGFAFEGAAMGLMLLDRITPWKTDRFRLLAHREGEAHIYMLHVGAGWALARLPWGLRRSLVAMDPLLGFLAVDGYGFHEGYFHWRRAVVQKRIPKRLRDYGRRAFDQGLGRSLWFIEGAEVRSVASLVSRFPESRRADLWSGVGLASAYAGGFEEGELELLLDGSARHRDNLALGAAFAAKARLRAGNLADHTETACITLCGMSAREAAAVTDRALAELSPREGINAYELWRRRVRESITEQPAYA